MESPEKDRLAQMSALEKELGKLARKAYAKIGLTALKTYLFAGLALLVGSLLIKPFWVAAKWLWNLY